MAQVAAEVISEAIDKQEANNSDGAAEIVRNAVSRYESGKKPAKRRDLVGEGEKPARRRDLVGGGEKPARRRDLVGEGNADNVKAAADDVRAVVQQVENLYEQRDGIDDDIKDVLGGAKERGVDVRAVKRIVADNRKSAEKKVAEAKIEDAVDTYRRWLGLAS